MVSTDLTYETFEVLQLLLRYGTQPSDHLPVRLGMLSRPQISSAVLALSRQGVVRSTASEIELIMPVERAQNMLEPYRVKRAVILAAGASSRMRPATNSLPKPMVTVGQKRLIETQLDALLEAGITDITIVRGFRGEKFDVLLQSYPSITFVESPAWHISGAIVSASHALQLLPNAYLIEGDLFISDPSIIRPYEYRTSYCGVECTLSEQVKHDWFFTADPKQLITDLAFGDSNGISLAASGTAHPQDKAYRFVGIMFWSAQDAAQLARDVPDALHSPAHLQQFIESIPFSHITGNYEIFARPLGVRDAIEVDTYEELQSLRSLQTGSQI